MQVSSNNEGTSRLKSTIIHLSTVSDEPCSFQLDLDEQTTCPSGPRLRHSLCEQEGDAE
jgi:hypothetical protein